MASVSIGDKKQQNKVRWWGVAKGKYEKWLTPDNLIRLEAWARDGLTDLQIATNMGIDTRTLYRWKEQHCQICQSLKKGKEVIDIEVENSLLKRALGYRYIETTRELFIDKSTGDKELQVTKTVTKEVVPDVTAQIIWLKNRKPDKWRDKPVAEPSDTDNKSHSDLITALMEGTNDNN